jgi:hypothetical protein
MAIIMYDIETTSLLRSVNSIRISSSSAERMSMIPKSTSRRKQVGVFTREVSAKAVQGQIGNTAMSRSLLGLILLWLVAAIPSTAEVLYTLDSPNEEQSGCFGYSVREEGHVNNGGYADIIVGAYKYHRGNVPREEIGVEI